MRVAYMQKRCQMASGSERLVGALRNLELGYLETLPGFRKLRDEIGTVGGVPFDEVMFAFADMVEEAMANDG